MGPLVPLLVSAASAVGGMLSQNSQSNLDRAQANANLDAQNKANRDLAQMTNEQNLARWRMENEYNSPSSQMARYKLAGLNPNLIYGQSNTSGGIPAFQAPTQSADRKAPDISLPQLGSLGSVLPAFQDMELKRAQIDNVKAGTDSVLVKTSNDVLAGKLAAATFDDRKNTPYLSNQERLHQGNIVKQREQFNRSGMGFQLEALRNAADRSQLTNDKILQDIIFRRFENDWMRQGVTRSDNPLIRMLTRQLGNPDSSIRRQVDGMKSTIGKFQSSSKP